MPPRSLPQPQSTTRPTECREVEPAAESAPRQPAFQQAAPTRPTLRLDDRGRRRPEGRASRTLHHTLRPLRAVIGRPFPPPAAQPTDRSGSLDRSGRGKSHTLFQLRQDSARGLAPQPMPARSNSPSSSHPPFHANVLHASLRTSFLSSTQRSGSVAARSAVRCMLSLGGGAGRVARGTCRFHAMRIGGTSRLSRLEIGPNSLHCF